jgi:hypothetical protein
VQAESCHLDVGLGLAMFMLKFKISSEISLASDERGSEQRSGMQSGNHLPALALKLKKTEN